MSKIEYQEESGVHNWRINWADRELKIQVGKFASQTNGECTMQYGDTVVLATAVMGQEPREGIDYFPLLVDFDEKFYAAGKIKGSRFIKREGRPSDEAILSGRIVDRSIRPFFNENLRLDVQVVISALSWDGENDPDSLGVIAAATALVISDIPWDGPAASVQLSRLDNKWLINATYEQRKVAELNLLVSVRENKVVMIEADGQEATESQVLEAVKLAIDEVQPVLELIKDVREKIGQEKKDASLPVTQELAATQARLKELTESFTQARLRKAMLQKDKGSRKTALDNLKLELEAKLKSDAAITKAELGMALTFFDELLLKATKELYLKQGLRIDGRDFEEIRPLSAEVALLPRTHGSGLFQRGETQALSILTLGPPSDEQILDTMEETDTKKRYMHHYNFPGFSVGEVKPNRGAGRREIGHGALAEKALISMIPDKEKFPYTLRVVTEILSSNGSSSMAATCGSTLALMDAGVPIKKPIAGIAMGLMSDDQNPDKHYRILTDIQGLEDHFGEMDFKITGTNEGITAIQLDVKNKGLSLKIVEATLCQARKALREILAVIKQTIPEPRAELSPYAPRVYALRINPEKIGDVIGPRGKVINEIIEVTGVAIDIEDDGQVLITSTDSAAADKAIAWVKNITREIKAGELFQGKVVKIMDFGAFVEVLPGQDGLVHISELAPFHVEKVTDVVKVGDEIPVKVIETDQAGRINLSLKQTDYEYPPEVMKLADRQQGPDNRWPNSRHNNQLNNHRDFRRQRNNYRRRS